MIGYVESSTGLSKRLGRVGKRLGKVFRGCGRISLVVPETTIDAFLCVVGKVGKVIRGIFDTATGGGRKGRTRQKGDIPFRALLKKNFPLCVA
jgi:hypothetical protein